MYLNKNMVLNYIQDMKKIYTDIHVLSEKGGVGIGDSSKYLGKIQALVEFEHYLNSGRFDDQFIKTVDEVINESQEILKSLAEKEHESVKIWIDKFPK